MKKFIFMVIMSLVSIVANAQNNKCLEIWDDNFRDLRKPSYVQKEEKECCGFKGHNAYAEYIDPIWGDKQIERFFIITDGNFETKECEGRFGKTLNEICEMLLKNPSYDNKGFIIFLKGTLDILDVERCIFNKNRSKVVLDIRGHFLCHTERFRYYYHK